MDLLITSYKGKFNDIINYFDNNVNHKISYIVMNLRNNIDQGISSRNLYYNYSV